MVPKEGFDGLMPVKPSFGMIMILFLHDIARLQNFTEKTGNAVGRYYLGVKKLSERE